MKFPYKMLERVELNGSWQKQRISVYKEILDEFKKNKEKYLNYLNQ